MSLVERAFALDAVVGEDLALRDVAAFFDELCQFDDREVRDGDRNEARSLFGAIMWMF